MHLSKVSVFTMSGLFVLWSAFFIFNTSFIAINGERYFSLFDDGMISMRYAWNVSHGMGLVWNEGEYVEGFTNFLMTMYMAVMNFIFEKKYAVLAIQISGLIFVLLNAFFIFKIARLLLPKTDIPHEAHPLVLALILIAALSYYPLLYWSLSGMEVSVLAVLISAAIYFTFKHQEQFVIIIPVLLGLAYLTRPDAAIAIAIILSFRAYHFYQAKKLPFIIWDGLIVLLFLLLMGGFRWFYYDSAFPNTYTLKMTGMDVGFRIFENGIGFITPFLTSMIPLLMVCVFAIFFYFKQFYLLFIGLFIAAVSYQIYVGGDPWLYWRQMAIYVPYLYLILIPFIYRMIDTFLHKQNLTKKAIVNATLVLCLILISNKDFYKELLFLEKPYQVQDNQHNVSTALILSYILKPNASIAVVWAGAIPYYAQFKAIDILGKSDAYIAGLSPDVSGSVSWNHMKSVPGHNKYDLNYSILEKRPTYTERIKWGQQNVFNKVKGIYYSLKLGNMTFFLLKNSKDIDWTKVKYLVDQNTQKNG